VLLNAGKAPVGFTLPPGRWTRRLASDAGDDEAAAQPLDATQALAPGSLWVAKT